MSPTRAALQRASLTGAIMRSWIRPISWYKAGATLHPAFWRPKMAILRCISCFISSVSSVYKKLISFNHITKPFQSGSSKSQLIGSHGRPMGRHSPQIPLVSPKTHGRNRQMALTAPDLASTMVQTTSTCSCLSCIMGVFNRLSVCLRLSSCG